MAYLIQGTGDRLVNSVGDPLIIPDVALTPGDWTTTPAWSGLTIVPTLVIGDWTSTPAWLADSGVVPNWALTLGDWSVTPVWSEEGEVVAIPDFLFVIGSLGGPDVEAILAGPVVEASLAGPTVEARFIDLDE